MTTSLPHTHIRLRDLSELVAGIPYVIGFPPTDSLVLFTFRRRPDLALSTTIRVDLPKPEHFPLVAAELTNAVVMNEAVAVIAVAVGEDAEEYGQLIHALRQALADRSILLSHASWVDRVAHGEQWQCYDDPLCTGIVPDPQSSALAAACAVAGDTTYPNREAIAAHLAPDPEETLAVRRKLLDAYRSSPAEPYTDADRDADLELLGVALDMALTSYDPPALTDDQLARLGIALSQPSVKDECLAIALSDEREPAERLWTVLVRALPAPERAEPAFLLAMSAYLRGAGVMAALALSIVMAADPLHSTAVLLDFALRMGVPPDQLRSLLMESILKNDEEYADSAVEEDDDPPWDSSPDHQTWPAATPEPFSLESPCCGGGVTQSAVEPVHTVWPPHGAPADDPSSSPADLVGGTPRHAAVPSSRTVATSLTTGDAENAVDPGTATWDSAPKVAELEPPRIPPGPLSQEGAVALGIHVDEPVTRTVTMDALTAFLPPPTDRIGPG